MSDFDQILAKIRKDAEREAACRYPLNSLAEFDAVRKAMVVAQALNYLGDNVPEARELVGEVEDLIARVRRAKEMTPVLEHFF